MSHRVFVYGSLLSGFGNHCLLADSPCLGETCTADARYRMYDLGAFPAVTEGGADSIYGEVYEVCDVTLVRLDRLEGHPNFYCRQQVLLQDGSMAWLYMLREQSDCPLVERGDWRQHVSGRPDSARFWPDSACSNGRKIL